VTDLNLAGEYAEAMLLGAQFSPVVVFGEAGAGYWLVDGFHRWHAHKALGLAEIAALVREGNALDALRASLRANAEHGKRREPADFRRGYQLAIKHQLVPPTDSEAVADLLRCSVQWARDLTASARERARILENEKIERLKAEGKSNRQIAAEVGVAEGTVRNRTAAQKGKSFVSAQPLEADPDDPRQIDIEDVLAEPTPAEIVCANLAEMAAPEVKDWHRALEAMRGINARPSPSALPPVLVIAEAGPPRKLWLADGYHRLFAHRAVGAVEIEAEVRRGTREDALRLSLAANATHGKQRTAGDFKRGYDIAVRNALVAPDDSVGLMDLLRCSIRMAEVQTEKARADALAKRNAEVIAAIDTDETTAVTAARLGVSQQLVAGIQRAELDQRNSVLVVVTPNDNHKTQTAECGYGAGPEQAESAAATDSSLPAEDGEEPPLLGYIAGTAAVPDDEPDEPDDDPDHMPVSVSAAELPDEATRLRAGMAEIDSPEVRM
jgi:ParB-like chromosome segregation protein Spo0J